MLALCINISKIKRNLAVVRKYLAYYNTDLVLVTKVLQLNEQLLSLLQVPKTLTFFDTKSENISLLKKNNYRILDRKIVFNYGDVQRLDPVKNYLIEFDLGDNRGGFKFKEAAKVFKQIAQVVNDVGIMSNIGCLAKNNITTKYFYDLQKLHKKAELAGLNVKYISVGGSICLPFVPSFKKIFGAIKTELRIGEAIFAGTIPGTINQQILSLKQDIFYLRAKVLSNNIDSYTTDFGYTHIEPHDINMKDLKILKQSSSNSLIGKNNSKKITSHTDLYLNYHGIAKLFLNKETTVRLK